MAKCRKCDALITGEVCPFCGQPYEDLTDPTYNANPYANSGYMDYGKGGYGSGGSGSGNVYAINDYLLANLLAFLFGGTLISIIGIVSAVGCSNAKKRGDYQTAMSKSSTAKVCFSIWLTVFLLLMTASVVLGVLGALGGQHQ